jgi:hypothetical protein
MKKNYEKAVPLPYEKRMKTCYECRQTKPEDEFSYKIKSRGYRASICKECEKIVSKKYAATHKEEMRAYKRAWKERNPEKVKEQNRKYAKEHPDMEAAKTKRYKERHPERVAAVQKAYRANNPEFIRKIIKIWRENNVDSINKQRKKRLRERFIENPEYEKRYRLNLNMASSIGMALKGKKNGRSWESLVGYTLDDLIGHLEKQFKPGMTWENRGKGGWHTDHIIPKSAFNFSSPEHLDFKKCWALKNLRPLWEEENLKKKDHLDFHFQPSLMMAIG